MDIPRVVIAAPASGSGKTTVATGLMAALSARGLAVSPHKVGPDYIDPGYHALAAGRPGRNLDAFLSGPERLAPLLLHGAAGADVAVVEGVMGMFDGAAGRGEFASTAHVAKVLRAPVVLVVDASSQSRSVAALVHGFASWDPQVRLGGVILNRVASDRHEQLLREALEEGGGVPVLGALRRRPEVATPSRHLGLVPAAERDAEALRAVRDMGELVRAGVDLDALLALARSAPPLSEPPWSAATEIAGRGGPAAGRPVVALASGAAFSFSYAENAELLAAAGAEVAPFDPLRDRALPPGTAGLVIGGGFPEVYAEQLSANAPLRAQVAALAASGAPLAAECAGLLYLGRSLDGLPMCGVLEVDARMTERLTLGYREAVALSDSPLAVSGTRVHGHEFHRTVCEPAAGAAAAWGWRAADGPRLEGFTGPSVHASYLHLHWSGAPELPLRLVRQAARQH
ncbi:cobyrinate a,c-diamide synthase [Streptacidiphilus sp. P02-A3a]|uniref:cobyrinate a,c-diamide synthase n=1 Tax=Streptacidiphilus sp. P02-A3a TaxID=2704468 RepID=UPI0015F8B5C1|nr:cobyrinate a,c-diamide synthase [Streptacidiphilus sp. P02-A3a]QMU71967.1 cobyrinate a,c-diamide synthase [Streptacidiphilus sp. P02-A3a]